MDQIEKTENNPFKKVILSWIAPEYIQHEKNWQWFLVAAIAVIAFIIYAIYTENWTLALALIAISGVYYWSHSHVPRDVEVIISRSGIKVGTREYPYQNIKAFWVIYKQGKVKTLNLRINSIITPDVIIQLGNQDPGVLREYLASQIREIEGKEETAAEALIRFLKI